MKIRRSKAKATRPAETATALIGALFTVVSAVFSITDPATLKAFAAVTGATPLVVTFLVEHFDLLGE